MLLPLGESSSAFLRGDETAFRKARSPNSRCCLSLNFITGPQTKNQKGKKTDGFAKKIEKVRRRKPTLAATPTPLLAQREHQLRHLVILMLFESQHRLLLVHVAGQSASL